MPEAIETQAPDQEVLTDEEKLAELIESANALRIRLAAKRESGDKVMIDAQGNILTDSDKVALRKGNTGIRE